MSPHVGNEPTTVSGTPQQHYTTRVVLLWSTNAIITKSYIKMKDKKMSYEYDRLRYCVTLYFPSGGYYYNNVITKVCKFQL